VGPKASDYNIWLIQIFYFILSCTISCRLLEKHPVPLASHQAFLPDITLSEQKLLSSMGAQARNKQEVKQCLEKNRFVSSRFCLAKKRLCSQKHFCHEQSRTY
jgi:hypothetical protein